MPSKQRRDEPLRGRPESNLERAKRKLKDRREDTKQKLRELKGEQPPKPDAV